MAVERGTVTPAGSRGAALPVLAGAARDASGDSLGASIRFVTLGCDKNTVDSERLAGTLAQAGAQARGRTEGDEVIVINTCGFIEAAKDESIETILDAVRLKREGRARAVVALGCLVQRYKEELEREIPEVDLFLGLTEVSRLVPELRARGLLPDREHVNMARPLRLIQEGSATHTSFLKVSEGCDHGCAFCAIPLMRGKHRSTPIEELVREAQDLEASGVVELNLVSQDTTWYGRDLVRGGSTGGDAYFTGRHFQGMAGPGVTPRPRSSAHHDNDRRPNTGLLPDLLKALVRGTDIPWLRLFYMYPSGIRPELVELMAAQPRIVPYLDMPIQHGSDSVLRRMRRPERRATILERVAWLRAAIPDLTLRTTIIVGFPGETDAEFEELLQLLEEVRFDRLGAFSYSIEEATPAADMGAQVDPALKRERLQRVQDLQRAITLERNEGWVDRVVDVLVDEHVGGGTEMEGATDARGALARTAGQAREIDGVVHIADAGATQPGQFVTVRITDALEDDLVGVRRRRGRRRRMGAGAGGRGG